MVLFKLTPSHFPKGILFFNSSLTRIWVKMFKESFPVSGASNHPHLCTSSSPLQPNVLGLEIAFTKFWWVLGVSTKISPASARSYI